MIVRFADIGGIPLTFLFYYTCNDACVGLLEIAMKTEVYYMRM